jgi:hypothetical protein
MQSTAVPLCETAVRVFPLSLLPDRPRLRDGLVQTTCGRALRRESLKPLKHGEARGGDARGLYGRDGRLFHGCRPRDAWLPRYGVLLHGCGVRLPFDDAPLLLWTWLCLLVNGRRSTQWIRRYRGSTTARLF